MKFRIALLTLLAVAQSSGQNVRGSTKYPGAEPNNRNKDTGAVALQARTDKFSMSVDAFAEKWGELDGSPIELNTFYQEMTDFQLALTLDPATVSKATFDEKVVMVQEFQRSFGIVERILSLMETSDSTMFHPFIAEVKKQMMAAESMTDDVLLLLDDLAGDDKKKSELPARLETPDVQTQVTFEPVAHRGRRLEEATSSDERHQNNYNNFHEEEDPKYSGASDKHWHGFQDHRKYRSWKNDHTRAFPHMRHLFQAVEDFHTGDHEGVRARALQRSNHHRERFHGRRLEIKSKRAQCDLLISCANDMSLYDLVFYHFSDYIDTTTGKFGDNFRMPAGFDILEAQASIQEAVIKAENEKNSAKRIDLCSDLLDMFHQNEATRDPDYWNWKAGAVSEVCYASGTTKKIDLQLIRKHIGAKPAVRILEQTILAAKTLYDSRNMDHHKSEPFVFQDNNGNVRYPSEILGLELDASGRPNLDVDLNSFYNYEGGMVTSVDDLHTVYGKQDICPNGVNGGIDSRGNLMCLDEDEKIATFCAPFVAIEDNHAYLAPDLTEAKKQLKRMVDFYEIESYKKRFTRLVLEVKNGVVQADPSTVGGETQREGKNGFVSKWGNKSDLESMVKKAQLLVNATRAPQNALVNNLKNNNKDFFVAVYYSNPEAIAAGHFTNMEAAKAEAATLRESDYETGIFVVKNGVVQVNEEVGTTDKKGRRMHEVAQQSISSMFYVFIARGKDDDDGKLQGFYYSFDDILDLVPSYDKHGTYCTFPVVDGVIQGRQPNERIWNFDGDKLISYSEEASYQQMWAEAQYALDYMTCTAPSSVSQDYEDEYAGWYDIKGCGQCNHYCRWVGKSGSGGDPSLRTEYLESKWTCETTRHTLEPNGDETYATPFTYERCHAVDALLNSTRRVFGDTSPGQIAALAEVGREEVNLAEAYCPSDWTLAKDFDPSTDKHGVLCLRDQADACDMDCAKNQCKDSNGEWIKDVDPTYTFDSTPYGCYYGKGCPQGWSGSFSGFGLVCTKQRANLQEASAQNECGAQGGTLSRSTDKGSYTCSLPDTYTLSTRKPELPGYCCLDTPDLSGIWGEPYTCSDTCQNFAPSLAGISQGTCDLYGGKFCPYPTDCTPLKQCVQRYLQSAEAKKGTAEFNPTYVSYLKDAPLVTNPKDNYQCGKTREYFGFEPSFPIDMKICDEIEEYQNSQDLSFMNDVFKSMPPAAKPNGIGGRTESKQNSLDGETYKAIQTAKKTSLGDPEETEYTCNADALTTWQGLKFGFDLAVHITSDIYDTAADFECPSGPVGVVATLCAVTKNISVIAFLIVRATARSVLEITNHLLDATACGELDPQSQGEMFEMTKAMNSNMGSLYDVLAERHAQSHAGLNALGDITNLHTKQLNSIADRLDELADAAKSSNRRQLQRNGTGLAESNTAANRNDETNNSEEPVEPWEQRIAEVSDNLNVMKDEMKAEIQKEVAAMKEEIMSGMEAMLKQFLLSSSSD